MAKLEVQRTDENTKSSLQLSGIIDEDADFSLINISECSDLEVDLEQLKSINSCGIREWVKWIGTASKAKISFKNCPKVIVDQINMVDGFLPANGRVASFIVPFYNDDSGSEKNILFSYGKEFDESGLKPIAEVKDDDGNVMEMDVIEAKYFKFIKKGA